jgi:DNA-binding HxlR family transcriptional regulator
MPAEPALEPGARRMQRRAGQAERQRTAGGTACPVAATLKLVGEWWTVLIVRDALRGSTRFEQFRRSLGISPAILARRLQTLVDAGVMERCRYQQHPPRDEYLLTESGHALQPLIAALRQWGERYLREPGAGS